MTAVKIFLAAPAWRPRGLRQARTLDRALSSSAKLGDGST